MVRNALESLEACTYKDFHVAVIDDGSEVCIEPELRQYSFGFSYYKTGDSVAQKKAQGGSRHGAFFNQAIKDIPSNLIITLCDDDAIINGYFENLNDFFSKNMKYAYAYSHVKVFDPFEETPGGHLVKRDHFLNKTGNIDPLGNVDSSQVCVQTNAHVGWEPCRTKNLDAYYFSKMEDKFGLCPYTGFDGQYKAVFQDKLGARVEEYEVRDL